MKTTNGVLNFCVGLGVLNFCVGLFLGVVGYAVWQYNKFLYYSVFCVQVIILFILINYSSISFNKDLTEDEK